MLVFEAQPAILTVPRCWDRRAYSLVSHIANGGVELMIGGPDRPPSSPYFACFTQESARKLANRKVFAFFVLLKFGDSTESSLTARKVPIC